MAGQRLLAKNFLKARFFEILPSRVVITQDDGLIAVLRAFAHTRLLFTALVGAIVIIDTCLKVLSGPLTKLFINTM